MTEQNQTTSAPVTGPIAWKDWVTAIGLLLTISTVMVRGGQVLEKLDSTNARLVELSGQVQQIRMELSATQRDIVAQHGDYVLHTEQIARLRRDIDTVLPRFRVEH